MTEVGSSMRNKRQRRELIRAYWVIGFNINWPKYLFSVFSLSLVQSLQKRIASLAASVNIEYIQIVLQTKEEGRRL